MPRSGSLGASALGALGDRDFNRGKRNGGWCSTDIKIGLENNCGECCFREASDTEDSDGNLVWGNTPGENRVYQGCMTTCKAAAKANKGAKPIRSANSGGGVFLGNGRW